jgi:hypothetical protein
MADIIIWPHRLLIPESASVTTVPFSRSGGRSLGGVSRTARSDRGFWRASMTNVWLYSMEQRRTWDAIDAALNGTAGLIAVPGWAFETAPHVTDEVPSLVETTHDDDTLFDDDTPYVQGAILMEMATFAPLSATTVTIRIVAGAPDPSGIRFGYQYALYKTGRVIEQVSEDTWRVEITPSIRAPIPADAILEADEPMVLCHLANDTGMNRDITAPRMANPSVEFVEAVDYWSDLAMGLVD